ncbi:hypothetical protein Tco_0901520 [Tanacetum coccineum]
MAYGVPTNGPYQTNHPSPDDIISSIRIDREGQVRRIRHEEEIDVLEYQVLTREIKPTLKPLEEIIWENVFCLGVIRIMFPRVFVTCFIVSYILKSLTLPISWKNKMEWVTKPKQFILPYCMLLTRLFKVIMNENPELYNESYVLYDHVMNPLAAQQERKARKDRGTRRGRHSTSFPSAFDQPSSSHLNDDDDNGNGEGTSRASTPSPIRYVNSLTNQVPQVFQNPPKIDPHFEPFYTRHTEIINRQVQIRDEQRGGLTQKLVEKYQEMRNMEIPSNPQLLQSHPSLDITLSLSSITPLDHILGTSSLPSSPQPQPPIMGHPLYYNYHDYHRSTCICCSHNQNLFLTLIDEMNIMFAHLEYLLTTAITSHFPPPP